jgi:predicted nuclease of restriction endonuclease-like (RecB) superfamily
VRLLDAVKVPEHRGWYANQAIEHGWSRNVLEHQIDSNLFARRGSALTNFSRTLPAEPWSLRSKFSKIRTPSTSSPSAPRCWSAISNGLIEHLRSLILELGKGFAFVGGQYHLEVGGQDDYLDLLFAYAAS